jgi:hypothetical protein
MVWSSIIDERHKRLKILYDWREIQNIQHWGWILELSKTIKQNLKTRQIHEVGIQTHYAWMMKSLKKLYITSISMPSK